MSLITLNKRINALASRTKSKAGQNRSACTNECKDSEECITQVQLEAEQRKPRAPRAGQLELLSRRVVQTGSGERSKFPETEDWLSVYADFAELSTCAPIASGRSLTAGARLIQRPPCLQALTRLHVLLSACELLSCCKYCATCTPLILSKLMQSVCCRSSRPKLSSLRIRTLSRHDING